ncbi:adenylate kinase 1, chloroplastic-like protein [Tanacetum coccineum]
MAALTRLVKLTSTISDLFVTRSLSTTTGGVSEIQSSANLSDGKGPGSRNFQWVFLGVPGVGKGTYASRLCNLLGVSHVAIGDLVWHELACKGHKFPSIVQGPEFTTPVRAFAILPLELQGSIRG